MQKKLIDFLNHTKSKKQIVSIFTDESDRSLFTPGYIDVFDEEWVRIKILDNYGGFDGYGLRPIASIVDAKVGSDYEKSLSKLHNRNHRTVFYEFEFDDKEGELGVFLSSIQYAFEKNMAITFWEKSNQDEHSGSIVKLDKDSFVLHKLKSYGHSVGEIRFNIDNVYMLDIGGNMERSFVFLNKSEQHQQT